jgi:hypothetical protein
MASERPFVAGYGAHLIQQPFVFSFGFRGRPIGDGTRFVFVVFVVGLGTVEEQAEEVGGSWGEVWEGLSGDVVEFVWQFWCCWGGAGVWGGVVDGRGRSRLPALCGGARPYVGVGGVLQR